MPQTGVVTILAVEQQSGVSQKNNRPWTRFDVKASDGNKYSTFDAPIAQAAGQSNGAPVILSFEERKNGEYTNYTLQGVTLANGSAPAPVAAPAAPAVVVQPSTGLEASTATASTYAQDKDARITRLSAASTAFSFASAAGIGPDEAIVLAAQIEAFANEGAPNSVNAVAVEQPAQAAAGLPWEA